MKIALLMQYEPFDRIAEATLAPALSASWKRPVRVEWTEARWQDRAGLGPESWLVVPELNAIFRPDADRAVFETVRDEYGTAGEGGGGWSGAARAASHTARALYIAASTMSPTSIALAPFRLSVSPDEPELSRHYLVMGGTLRMRVIDRGSGEVISVLKEGVRPDTMHAEVSLRWNNPWLPAPPLIRHDPAHRMTVEMFVRGVAMDRVVDRDRAEQAIEALADMLARLRGVAVQRVMAGDFASATITTVERRARGLPPPMRGQFVEGAGALARMLDSGEIECCASHGDLQPGNVLLGKGGGVTVIDWERTIPRAAWFDPLTFSLEARKGLGLAERVERFIAEGPDIRAARLLGDLTRDAAGREGRRRMLAVHLLEQMEYYLSEQVMSRFTRPGPGLSALMAEWKDLVSSFI